MRTVLSGGGRGGSAGFRKRYYTANRRPCQGNSRPLIFLAPTALYCYTSCYMARIMIIAGEVSGDLHGGQLVAELRARVPELDIYGIGGDRMAARGVDLVHHVRDLSFMGVAEVLLHLPFIRSVMRGLTALLDTRRPDLVVLIDYPGFNLRFARQAKRRGIPVVYYVSPQVWAWGRGRVRKIRRLVARMLVILPFEQQFYRDRGIPALYVGNPLIELAAPSLSPDAFRAGMGLDATRPLVGLLPGSRGQEVEAILPVMLATCRMLREQEPSLQFVLALAPHIDRERVASLVADSGLDAVLAESLPYDVMAHSRLALVASGTATLETGIIGTPMIVIYKTSALTYWLGRLLVRVPYIGLVNLVAGKQVVPEFVQGDARPGAIFLMARLLLADGGPRSAMMEGLAAIRARLAPAGAAARAAAEIAQLLPDRSA